MYTYGIGRDKVTQPYEGPRAPALRPENYNRGLYGGADLPNDKWRILQWNLRTGNKHPQQKIRLIREANPLIGFLNEVRRPIEVRGYNSYSSLAAPGKHAKINAQLLIH